MSDPRPRPCRRQVLEAMAWALCVALLFLRGGVLPSNALMPFPPEVFEPLRSEVLASGEIDVQQLDAGNPSMGDKYNQSLCWDRVLQDRLRRGELPLWTNDIGGGVPFVPQMAQVFQPWNLLLALLPVPSCGIYGVWLLFHLALLGVFAYWFARRLGVAHAAALIALVTVELGFWAQARTHHNVILSAALPLFPLLSLVDGAFRAAPLSAARIACVALGFGISWSGGFAPVSLQTTGFVVAFAIYRAVEQRRAAPLRGIGVGLALGGLLALPQMGPTLLASLGSSRPVMQDTDLAANGLSLAHLRTLLFPDLLNWPDPRLVGGASGPPWAALELLDYHQAASFNFPETAFAIGLPGLVLALTALRRPGRLGVFLLLLAALAFGLATASAPFLALSRVIPGARAGDLRRFLFLAAMALPLLAAFGGASGITRARDRLSTVLALCCAALAAWNLVDVVRHGQDLDGFRAAWADRLAHAHGEIPRAQILAAMQVRPFEAQNNLDALTATFARTLAVALGTAALCWFVRGGARLRGLAALAALELCHAGSGTIVPVPTARVERLPRLLAPVADATQSADANHAPRPRMQRVDPLAGSMSRLWPPNLAAYHGIEDLGAYDPLPSARREQLFDAIEPRTADARGEIRAGASLGGAGVGPLRHPDSIRHPLLDLLDCRFVLIERSYLPADPTGFIDRTPPDLPRTFALIERTTTLPRATFVDRIEVVPDAARRLRMLADPNRDFVASVILEDIEAPDPGGDGKPDAEVTLVEHRDELVRIDVTAREPGYLRLADPYDPGWTATIDGADTTVLCADHDNRAVFVPPGAHRIEFRFDDLLRVRAWNMAGACGLLVSLGLIVAGRLRRRTGAFR